MNKCIHCKHESDNDVTDYMNYDSQQRLIHQWYCRKCKNNWLIVDECTYFPERLPDHLYSKPRLRINDVSFNFQLPEHLQNKPRRALC